MCLLGHSFIRRLDDFMDNSYNYYNLRLPESKFNIISRAKGGLTIRRLINERPELFDNKKTYYIFVATNQLDTCYSE